MSKKLNIVRYGINGEGIAICDGKVFFVPYAMMEEEVLCDELSSHKNFVNAKLLEVSKCSPNRVEPVCPYYYECGGCDLLHIDYDEQLKIKKEIVENNLKKYSKININIKKIINKNKFNYRNHITFAVSENGRVGFFKGNSHNVVEIKKCFLINEKINKCIEILNSYFFDNKLFGFNYLTKKGEIKQVDIKYISDQLLITFVATINELPNLDNLIVRLNCLQVKFGINLSVNTSDDTYVYGKLKHLYGIEKIEAFENNITSFVSSFSFVQVNSEIKEEIYNHISSLVKDEIVVDAYAGRGVLTSMLSKTAKKVYGIEIEHSSVCDAMLSLDVNKIANVEFIEGDTKEVLPQIESFDTLVLDPPRKGVSENVIKTILEKLPKQIVYLSCASNTLARDLNLLKEKYEIEDILLYEMFPNTKHIETLVVLKRK